MGFAAGQHAPRGADLGTMFQRGPHGGHGIRPGSAWRKEIFQVDGFFRRSRCHKGIQLRKVRLCALLRKKQLPVGAG